MHRINGFILAALLLICAAGAVAQNAPLSPVTLGQATRSRGDAFTISITSGPASVQRATVMLSRNGNVHTQDVSYAPPLAGGSAAFVSGRLPADIALGNYRVVVELDGKPFPVEQQLQVVPPGSPESRLDEFNPPSTDHVGSAYLCRSATCGPDERARATRVARVVLRGAGFQTGSLQQDNVILINGVRETVDWDETCPELPYGTEQQPKGRKIVAQAVSGEEIDLCMVPVPSNGEVRVQVGLGDTLSKQQMFRVYRMGRTTVGLIATLLAAALALLPLGLLSLLKDSYAIEGRRYKLRLLFLDPETNTYSLSKLQFYMWTVAALFGYSYLFISRVLVQFATWPDVPGTLPGIIAVSAGTSVAAQLVTGAKGSQGAGTERPSFADFITSGGVVAPDRLQMLLWTIFGVGAFMVVVLGKNPGNITELPTIPDGLMYLMGLSSVGYLGGKMARKPGPVINEIWVTPADSDEAIALARQPAGSDLPDLTAAIGSASAKLSALRAATSAAAKAAQGELVKAISATSAAQTTSEIDRLIADLTTMRVRAETAAAQAAEEFAATAGASPDEAMLAQQAAVALQELAADVTQAVAICAAQPMLAATTPLLVARTITLRGTNLSSEAILEIDHADLPFRMLLNAEGDHAPEIVVREDTAPTFARVMRLNIDPARLDGADLDRFQRWFRAGGTRTFTIMNLDGQKAEVTFPLPPGEAQIAGTKP